MGEERLESVALSSAADTGERNAPFSLSSDVRPLARFDIPKREGVGTEKRTGTNGAERAQNR